MGNAGRSQHCSAGHGDHKYQGKDIHLPLGKAKVKVWTMPNGLAQGEGILRGEEWRGEMKKSQEKLHLLQEVGARHARS